MGFAYYANYLVWFEVGRGAYCRQRGISYQEMEKKFATFLPVVDARCRYKRPLKYDQEVLVRTRISRFQRRGVTFEYQITDQGREVVYSRGLTRHIFTDGNGKPRSLPAELVPYFT